MAREPVPTHFSCVLEKRLRPTTASARRRRASPGARRRNINFSTPRAAYSSVGPGTRSKLDPSGHWLVGDLDERYRFRKIFPEQRTEGENLALCATGPGAERPFACLMTSIRVPDLNFFGPGTVPQWLPVLRLLGRRHQSPREHHRLGPPSNSAVANGDRSLTKWDIFHYIYAVLHHTEYRSPHRSGDHDQLGNCEDRPLTSAAGPP